MVPIFLPESEITSDLQIFIQFTTFDHMNSLSTVLHIDPSSGTCIQATSFDHTFHTKHLVHSLGHIHRNRPCLMDKHMQAARKVKCAQDAADVMESHLQEDMRSNERRGFRVVHMQRTERRALQTIGAKLFNKGKDDQLTARIPKCSKDDLEVCVRECVILVTIPNFRTMLCLLFHYNIHSLQLFRFPEKVSCNSCLQRLLDTHNQGTSWMAVTSCHYSCCLHQLHTAGVD